VSIKTSISRTIKRLNLHSVVMNLPIFGKALYDALSKEFSRVNDFKNIVKSSTVPNENMDISTIDDNELKYGIDEIISATDTERIARIIERAQRNGNGGPDWIQDQIQKAGFDLYVILNEKNISSVFQFGDFQFNDIQFGGAITYTDPDSIPGELVASSPNGDIGGQFLQFGDFQFGSSIQFGTLAEGFAYPQPKPFKITTNPNRWGYFFFLSPFYDHVALESELLEVSEIEWKYLKKTVIQLKHLRNWAIVQVKIV